MELHGKTKISFTRAFTSPVYGNVWKGRELTLPHKQAIKLINAGLAAEILEKAGGTISRHIPAKTPEEKRAEAAEKKRIAAAKKALKEAKKELKGGK